MNTELMNAIAAADEKAKYDACAKRLIGQKRVLAHILVNTVDEFKGMQPEEVAAYIEGDPKIGIVSIDPGLTNRSGSGDTGTLDSDSLGASDERIRGLNTEDSEINEGTVRFDIIFYVRMKAGLAQMIINVEIQKNQPKQYHLLNRSIYYVSRMISSQKGRDFLKSNYNDIKAVYSIWICLNMDENSLTRYYLSDEQILGSSQWKGRMDLLNIVFIGLTKKVPEKGKKYELHRLLSTLLSDTMKVQEKIKIIEDEYHIPVNNDLRRDVNVMCNLGEGIEERATKRVTEEFVKSMYEKNFSLEQIADVAHKSVAEIEEIIKASSLMSV